MRYNQNLFSVTFKPHFPKKKKNPAKQALSIFCNSLQYALHPCCNFLFLFGLTNARKCERSLSLRTFTVYDWTSAPEKLPFWPERNVIGHDLVSYPTWRRPICELRYSEQRKPAPGSRKLSPPIICVSINVLYRRCFWYMNLWVKVAQRANPEKQSIKS